MVFTAGSHERSLRHAIARYKYGEQRWWADVFARMLAEYVARHEPWFEEFALLAAVPSATGSGARRKWDPVGEILARLAHLLGPVWDIQAVAVAKRCETPAMQGRDGRSRQAIATGPLRRSLWVPDPQLVAGRRVLVLDDVLTDGSTLREVARALRAAGALEVAGLVLARTIWSGNGTTT